MEWGHWPLVLVAVGLAYLNSFGAGFVLDNRAVILEDPRNREFSWSNLRAIWTQDYWPFLVSGTYRPVTRLSYLVNYAVLGNGDRPGGYHLVNLSLHLANVMLVYGLARRCLGGDGRWLAAVGAAWFGLHSIATEAVTNVVGRADLLATLAVLGRLHCHMFEGRLPVLSGTSL